MTPLVGIPPSATSVGGTARRTSWSGTLTCSGTTLAIPCSQGGACQPEDQAQSTDQGEKSLHVFAFRSSESLAIDSSCVPYRRRGTR